MSEVEIKLTAKQISDMRHAIGYSVDRVTQGRYKPFRNHYAIREGCKSWDQLVKIGFATKGKALGTIYYNVSSEGIQYLSEILGCKIIEEL